MDASFALQALVAVIPVYLIIMLGFALRKRGIIKLESDSSFTRFSIDVAVPCFLFASMIGNEKLADTTFALGTIAIGFVGMGCALGFSWLAAKIMRLKIGDGQRTFAVTTGSSNYGFFLISMVILLYPQNKEIVGIIITHNVGCDIIFWSLGFLLISGVGKISLRVFCKPPIIAVALALIFIWTGLAPLVPQFLQNTLKIIGACAIPLNLMLFGCMIYDFWGLKNFNIKLVSIACALRMLVYPALYITAAYFLPIDPSLKLLLALQAILPCGVTSAVLSKHFGGHPQMSVQITVATALIALITLPLYLTFATKLLGL